MTKEEYLQIAASKYEELASLKEEKDFYNYEKRFVEIMDELSRLVLESQLGGKPKDKRKKSPLKPLKGK